MDWVRSLVLFCLCGWAYGAIASAPPDFESVQAEYRTSAVMLWDRHGRPLERVRTNFDVRQGVWLELDDISPALIQAVIHSEDRRFYDHSGVDVLAMAAAAWNILRGKPSRGASTISMQLAALIEPRHERPSGGRGVLAKIDQAVYAQALERRWSKRQILEAYLNLAPFRGELVGVDALSQVLFQKHASGLDARESALAAAMLRGPNVSTTLLTQRTCTLLRSTVSVSRCDNGLKLYIESTLRNHASVRNNPLDLAPHFARWVMDEASPSHGEQLYTTLDADLQRKVLDIVEARLYELAGSHVRDVAVVVLGNESGEVLAYVGSSGSWSVAPWVDHAKALRQAGSTLKPFLYQQALEQQRLTTVSLLNDAPLNLPTASGVYVPRNYDQRFAGWVSARTALASSLNVPAVRVITMVTPDDFRNKLVQLGIPLVETGDFYGYSLALGSADVSLLSLTNAYRTLANLGMYSEPVILPLTERPKSRRTMQRGSAWIIGDVLSDVAARARTFGLHGPLTTSFWTAVKTGTSKDMRDNWTLGWSEHYTVGVWVGNSSGASMRQVSGVTGAGPIWHDIITYLHRSMGSVQPERPIEVHEGHVRFDGEIEPARRDYFIGDTLVTRVRRAEELSLAHAHARIVTPTTETTIALDPDMPPAYQRVRFRATGSALVSWRVDKQTVGEGVEMLWLPSPGRHHIELVDAKGATLDSVDVTVRGAIQLPELNPEYVN